MRSRSARSGSRQPNSRGSWHFYSMRRLLRGSLLITNRINATSAWKADFFTFDDNGSYQVFLSVADDDDGVGTASQTIAVTNVAPVLSNVKISSGTVNDEGLFNSKGLMPTASSSRLFPPPPETVWLLRVPRLRRRRSRQAGRGRRRGQHRGRRDPPVGAVRPSPRARRAPC